MLSIGAFSKISRVSPNALRYYDEIGLIKPARVDSGNGYRYYGVEQLETILMINKLKAYHLSLEEISQVLQQPQQNDRLLTLIREKRGDARLMLHNLNYTLNQMDQDIQNLEKGRSIMSYLDQIEIRLKETTSRNLLSIRKQMSTEDYGICLTQLYEQINREKLTAIGPPITIFHIEDEFNPDCYDNEVAIPVIEAAAATRVLPGGLCAVAMLNGPYTELSAVYTKLQQWVDKEHYTQIGEAYEVYLTNPFTTAPENNRTEVYVPIKKEGGNS